MPGMNGIQAACRIKSKYPEVKVLVLTNYAEIEWVFDTIPSGTSG